jgi:hypothetical protein
VVYHSSKESKSFVGEQRDKEIFLVLGSIRMFIMCLGPEHFQWYLTEIVYKDESNLTRYIGINYEVWIWVLKEKEVVNKVIVNHFLFNHKI